MTVYHATCIETARVAYGVDCHVNPLCAHIGVCALIQP